jgi:hypothetical protein
MTDGEFSQHYSTPGRATDGLLANETFTGTTAAGEGAIARLRPQSVVASDLGDYGFGEVRDFFAIRVITKPTLGSQQRFHAWPGGRPTTAKPQHFIRREYHRGCSPLLPPTRPTRPQGRSSRYSGRITWSGSWSGPGHPGQLPDRPPDHFSRCLFGHGRVGRVSHRDRQPPTSSSTTATAATWATSRGWPRASGSSACCGPSSSPPAAGSSPVFCGHALNLFQTSLTTPGQSGNGLAERVPLGRCRALGTPPHGTEGAPPGAAGGAAYGPAGAAAAGSPATTA